MILKRTQNFETGWFVQLSIELESFWQVTKGEIETANPKIEVFENRESAEEAFKFEQERV